MAELGNRIGGSGPKGKSMDSRVGGIQDTQAQLQAAQGAQPPTAVDLLSDPESLIKLGLAVAGGLSGNENLQALGLGVGMGTLDSATMGAQQAAEAQQKQIADLQGTLEKQQARLTTLMQSQPGLFVDEEGKDVYTPEAMGKILGTSVPTSASALVARRQQATLDAANIKAGTMLVVEGQKSNNQKMMEKGLHILTSNLPWGNISNEDIRRMSMIDRTPSFDDLAEYFTADSVVEAIDISQRYGGNVLNPESIEVLIGNPADEDQLKLTSPEALALWEATKVFKQWIKDNPDLVASLPKAQQVEAAFVDRADLNVAYTTKYTTARGAEVSADFIVDGMLDGFDFVAKLDVLKSGLMDKSLTQAQFDEKVSALAGKYAAAAAVAKGVANSQQTSAVALQSHVDIKSDLATRYPGLAPQDVEAIVGEIINLAVKTAGGQSISSVDSVRFQRALSEVMTKSTIDSIVKDYQ